MHTCLKIRLLRRRANRYQVYGIRLNEIRIEQLQSLSEEGVGTMVSTLMRALEEPNPDAAAAGNMFLPNVVANLCGTCCDSFKDGPATAKAQRDFLEIGFGNLDTWPENDDPDELWLNIKLIIFAALCCPKRKGVGTDRPDAVRAESGTTETNTLPKATPRASGAKRKNPTALADVATLLLEFEDILNESGVGKHHLIKLALAAGARSTVMDKALEQLTADPNLRNALKSGTYICRRERASESERECACVCERERERERESERESVRVCARERERARARARARVRCCKTEKGSMNVNAQIGLRAVVFGFRWRH